jgi:hypothetical protein
MSRALTAFIKKYEPSLKKYRQPYGGYEFPEIAAENTYGEITATRLQNVYAGLEAEHGKDAGLAFVMLVGRKVPLRSGDIHTMLEKLEANNWKYPDRLDETQVSGVEDMNQKYWGKDADGMTERRILATSKRVKDEFMPLHFNSLPQEYRMAAYEGGHRWGVQLEVAEFMRKPNLGYRPPSVA